MLARAGAHGRRVLCGIAAACFERCCAAEGRDGRHAAAPTKAPLATLPNFVWGADAPRAGPRYGEAAAVREKVVRLL